MSEIDRDEAMAQTRRVASEVARVADRLRSMDLSKLADVAVRTHAVAQELGDAVAVLTGAEPRLLPQLALTSTGDLVAVTGADLAEALRDHPDAAVVGRALSQLEALRALL